MMIRFMKFGIVCSQYHSEYTDALLNSARNVLSSHQITVVRVPGAFEIPYALEKLAKKRFNALIALGLIWQGQTDHARLISEECARACMSLSLQYNVPIIFEVLTVNTKVQAQARCLGKKLNRGIEAAKTALTMAQLKI